MLCTSPDSLVYHPPLLPLPHSQRKRYTQRSQHFPDLQPRTSWSLVGALTDPFHPRLTLRSYSEVMSGGFLGTQYKENLGYREITIKMKHAAEPEHSDTTVERNRKSHIPCSREVGDNLPDYT